MDFNIFNGSNKNHFLISGGGNNYIVCSGYYCAACGGGSKAVRYSYGGQGAPANPSYSSTMGTLHVNTGSCGNFRNSSGVIAIKFKIGGDFHYGWINYHGFTNTGTIKSWGYETDANKPVSDYPSDPTLVELTAFTATAGPQSVQLTWQTASEMDSAGFHLWRSENRDWGYEKITDALIPAEGSPTQGASYTFDDKTAKPGKTYYYKLEDVGTGGSRSYYGPVSAQMSAAIPALSGGGLLLAGAALAGAGVAILRRRRKDHE